MCEPILTNGLRQTSLRTFIPNAIAASITDFYPQWRTPFLEELPASTSLTPLVRDIALLSRQPGADHFHNISLLFRRKLSPLRDLMPLLQTSPATGSGCVLCDEYRMVAPGCLFSVIEWRSWRQPRLNELRRMLEDLSYSFPSKIVKFLLS